MKKAFACSLCRGGIIGGTIYAEDGKITYKTNKLTIAEKYRKIVLPLEKIDTVVWKRIIFPVATFKMMGGEEHTFIIFNKKGFLKHYAKMCEK